MATKFKQIKIKTKLNLRTFYVFERKMLNRILNSV